MIAFTSIRNGPGTWPRLTCSSRAARGIALLNGPVDAFWGFKARYNGYAAALRDAGIEIDPKLHRQGAHGIDSEAGRAMFRGLLDDKVAFDGVVGVTDSKAMGAMALAAERGLVIGRDVSFVSIDDTIADQSEPPLSAIAMPFEEMGRQVALKALEVEQRNSSEAGRREKIALLQQICLQPYLVRRPASVPRRAATAGKNKNQPPSADAQQLLGSGRMKANRMILAAVAACTVGFLGTAVHAGTYAPITIDGNFSDWTNVSRSAASGTADGATIDPIQLKLANDATNMYVLITFATPVASATVDGTYLVVDSDGNKATGFDVFGQGVIGSNTAFENDYPFSEATGNYNDGTQPTGATFTVAPSNTTTTSQEEIAIPLTASQVDATAGGYTGLLFPATNAFSIGVFTDAGGVDTVLASTPYTLGTPVAVPEPASLSLLALGAAPLLRARSKLA